MTQPTNSGSGTLAVSNANHSRDGQQVVRSSIRVLIDSNTVPTCDNCGASITHGARYRSVSVRERNGGITDLAFCDEHCRSHGL
jgi:hypothetical protein